ERARSSRGSWPDTRATFDLHLLICPSCRAYLASYRETIELVRGAAEKEEQQAHDAPPELIEAVLTSRSPRPKS
ncbi:MAG TPA: hypothetical protein VNN08_17630, partial [Thermoanaerobaculia bacterium]|nr:hypothetical protein [Thermoanaerobaculia bacterium]